MHLFPTFSTRCEKTANNDKVCEMEEMVALFLSFLDFIPYLRLQLTTVYTSRQKPVRNEARQKAESGEVEECDKSSFGRIFSCVWLPHILTF